MIIVVLAHLLIASVARYRKRNKQAGPMSTSPKQATSSFVVKKKERDYYTLHTHTYHPETRNVIVFIIVFLWCDPFCFSSRTSKQYDMQYNRKRNTLTTSPKTRNLRLPIFISDFTESKPEVAYNKQTWQLC